jgi:hypothetical protein
MARARRRQKKSRPKKARPRKARPKPKKTQPKKSPQRRSRRTKPRPVAKRRVRIVTPQPTRAEALLLSLAKDLAGSPLDKALPALASAFAEASAELPRELFAAWIKSRHEKTASLALSWAREQLRLSLEETIAQSPKPPATPALTPDTLAWLLLAACESIAYEPPSAVADRVRTVLELSGHASPVG